MKLKVIKPFDWAHEHVRVESYGKGQTIDTEDADLIRVAVEEGWAKPAKGDAAPASEEDAGTEQAEPTPEQA